MGEREEMEDRMLDILELSCVVCVVDVSDRWSVGKHRDVKKCGASY